MGLDLMQYKGHILFVDDAKVNLMMGSKILRNFGLEVKTAENGQQAIEYCKNNTFQLIFMDLEMPEIGGLDATRILREKKLSFAPIVALTSHEGEDMRLLCRSARMNGYITKPLSSEKVLPFLDKIL